MSQAVQSRYSERARYAPGQAALRFDLPAGDSAKEVGIRRAIAAKETLVEQARGVAEVLAMLYGTVTADDVQEALLSHGLGPLGNAAGGVFARRKGGPPWEFTGEWRRSRRVSNHGHQNRVWRLAGSSGRPTFNLKRNTL